MAAAIVVENVSKRYRLTPGAEKLPYRTLRDDLARLAAWPLRRLRHGPRRAEDFWALKDVTFEVAAGARWSGSSAATGPARARC